MFCVRRMQVKWGKGNDIALFRHLDIALFFPRSPSASRLRKPRRIACLAGVSKRRIARRRDKGMVGYQQCQHDVEMRESWCYTSRKQDIEFANQAWRKSKLTLLHFNRHSQKQMALRACSACNDDISKAWVKSLPLTLKHSG